MCTMEINGVTYAVEMKTPSLTKEQSDAQIASYVSLLEEQNK